MHSLLRHTRPILRVRPYTTATQLQPRRPLSFLKTTLLLGALTTSAYTLGAIYPPGPLALLFAPPAPPPPADPTSAESLAILASLEKQLHALPILSTLRSRADAAEWYECRPYASVPEERRVNNFTAGALRGPGKLGLVPWVWAKRDESEAVVVVHVGRGLCGHDGIIHGGLLATVLDEALARNAVLNLPDKVGVTAKLDVQYRAPTGADQFIVVKTKLIKTEGRKAWVEGRVEDLSGKLLIEATGLFVQPKYAKFLSTPALRQLMGTPQKKDEGEPIHIAGGQFFELAIDYLTFLLLIYGYLGHMGFDLMLPLRIAR